MTHVDLLGICNDLVSCLLTPFDSVSCACFGSLPKCRRQRCYNRLGNWAPDSFGKPREIVSPCRRTSGNVALSCGHRVAGGDRIVFYS